MTAPQKCARCEFYPRVDGDLCGRCATWVEREKRGDTWIRCMHPEPHGSMEELAACHVDQMPPFTPAQRSRLRDLLLPVVESSESGGTR